MKKLMLTILSVLMVVGLVLPVSAEGTSPATKEIPVKFLLNDGTGVAGAVNVTGNGWFIRFRLRINR